MSCRLHFLVEGQTEAEFVTKVLAPHLHLHGVFVEPPTIVYTSKEKNGFRYKGGASSWGKVEHQMLLLMRGDSDPSCRFSMMFDFYGFPMADLHFDYTQYKDRYAAVADLEHVLKDRIYKTYKEESHLEHVNDRLIPFVMLHEFEALVFADPQSIDWQYVEDVDAVGISTLCTQAETVGNPELVNNGPDTAPSKRILKAFPSYHKTTDGIEIVSHIGIDKLKASCRHFREWIEKLELLGNVRGL